MSTDILFEHFATLATAPDGITRLRELILQLAVQGKLGTQDAGDEPANILLKKINAEKKQQVKEGKIKKENLLPPTQEKESPYLLPKGWQWATLNDVFLDIRSGGTPSKNNPQFWDGDIYWASVKDLKDIKYLESTQDKITQKGLEECRSKLIPPGNLIICVRMGLGKIAINKVPIAINQDLKAADLSKNVDINYFYNFYRAQTVKGTGMTVDGIRQEKLLLMPFPLPPLAEQHRIVDKVDRLMALCDELEARQQQERAGCLKLGIASLAELQNATHPEEFGRQWAQVCDVFDMILDCPENVAALRQTILQLAVQGRLVRQDAGDEPAKKLVEKIRQEKERLVNGGKIKPEKSLDPLDRNMISYKIPESWSYEYLNDLCELVVDPDHNMPKAVETGVKFISSKDLNDEGVINFSRNIKLISEEDYSRLAKKFQPKRGDILFARIGARIGKPCIVESDERFMISYSCCVIRPLLVDTKFINYFLKEASFIAVALEKTQGIGVPDLGMKMIKQFVVPLPPLAEQHRIVAKVDALMALCDALESRLKERAGVQGRLAGAVVKEIAG